MAQPQVLNAEDFGVPQKRRRVFFVGNRLDIDFEYPTPTHDKKSFAMIKDILENDISNSIEIDPEKVPHFDYENVLELEGDLEVRLNNAHPFLKLRASEDRISFGKRISPNHIELSNLSAPTKTIHCGYAFQPRLFVPIKYKNKYYAREFTTSELAQIQGFPANYKFAGNKNDIVKQIGNAVPSTLSKVIAEKIISYNEKPLNNKTQMSLFSNA